MPETPRPAREAVCLLVPAFLPSLYLLHSLDRVHAHRYRSPPCARFDIRTACRRSVGPAVSDRGLGLAGLVRPAGRPCPGSCFRSRARSTRRDGRRLSTHAPRTELAAGSPHRRNAHPELRPPPRARREPLRGFLCQRFRPGHHRHQDGSDHRRRRRRGGRPRRNDPLHHRDCQRHRRDGRHRRDRHRHARRQHHGCFRH